MALSSTSRAFQAAAAAFCSASFLDRPTPEPYSLSITTTTAVNSLSWSGPVEVTRYDGAPSPRAAVSSCKLVFQSNPAPRVGAASSNGPNIRWPAVWPDPPPTDQDDDGTARR
ncbi:Uncharacterised protein [Mycobacterium tuberculosis]|nr:Uncharacterised protein [Mycobacterium tuberculosis]